MEFRFGVFLYTLLLFNGKSLAIGMLGSIADREENCILSFVVPRDKIKSSCDMDRRVKQHLNSMEIKLHMYKQQVIDLQNQLEKERMVNFNKFQALEEKIGAFNAKENYHILEEKLENLETKLQEEPGLMINTRSSKGKTVSHKELSKDSDYRKNMVEVITPVVRAEVEKYLENFTQEFDNTIRNDASYYDFMNMIPRNDQQYSGSNSDDESRKNGFPETEARSKSDKLWNDFDKIRKNTNTAGNDIATKVRIIVKKYNSTKTTNILPTANKTNENYTIINTTPVIENITVFDNDNFTVNENASEVYSTEDDFISPVEGGETTSVVTNNTDNTTKVDFTQAPKSSVSKREDSEQQEQQEQYFDNMEQQDQSVENSINTDLFTQEIEKLVRDEVTKMLHAQLDEVESLMKKQQIWVDGVVDGQDKELKTLAESHSTDIKEVENKFDGLHLEISSITQSMQEYFFMAEKLQDVQNMVDEIKTNLSSSPVINSNYVEQKIDEHSKMIRKLEQLHRIFQQTVQHYRNESKNGYSEIKDKLSAVSNQFKVANERIFRNITTNFGQKLQDYKSKIERQIEVINSTLRILDNNYVILNLDHNDLERRMKSRTNKLTQDVEWLKSKIDRLQQQNSRWKQIHKNLADDNHNLQVKNNETLQVLKNIQLELKLSASDTWVDYNFVYDTSQTECFGKQYIKKTTYKHSSIVGVVLCTKTRYKIFLARNLDDKFLNIGDSNGLGEDHCEFIGAVITNGIHVSRPAMSMQSVQGFLRDNWGEEPKLTLLNFMRPSPAWYECGISIP